MSGEKAANVLGYPGFAVSYVIIPVSFLAMICQKLETLRKEQSKSWFGALYYGLKLKTKWQAAFYVIFALRRLIFVIVVFFVNKEYMIFQLLILCYCNLIIIIYLGGVYPLESRFMNRLGLFNEGMICCASIHMMFFSEWIDSVEQQFELGYSMIAVIIITIAFNMLVVFITLCK